MIRTALCRTRNPGQPQVQNPANLHEEKAISIQDVPQTLVLSYVYELPFGKGKAWVNHGPLSYVIGGWKIGGVQRYQTGHRLRFCCSSGIPGWQQAIRYNETGAPIKSAVYRSGWKNLNPFNTSQGSDPSVNSFFNGAVDNAAPAYSSGAATPAFVDQNLEKYRNGGPFRLGNTPRVTNIRMPAWNNEDFSLIKATPHAREPELRDEV